MPLIKAGAAKLDKGAANDPLGRYTAERISDTGGLSQFGAFVEELEPGAASSLDHWHAEEDEMVYILHGTPTLRENGVETLLGPGDAACWPAGAQSAHCLLNKTDQPVRYLVIGTRTGKDVVTYPFHNRVLTFDHAAQIRKYTTLDGKPADRPAPKK